jgi:hypothetical protein
MVGSLFRLIDRFDRPIRAVDRSTLLGKALPPISHGSILYRKWAFDRVGQYRAGSDYFEDADLYGRLMKLGDILIIADDLISYRQTGTSARLLDDRAKVERALNVMPSALAIRDCPQAQSEKIEPEVFRTFGTLRLWSYQRPGILLEMVKRMRLRPFRYSARVFLWAFACTASPSLARQATRIRLNWRNWRIRHSVPAGHLFRWLQSQPAIDLGLISRPAASHTRSRRVPATEAQEPESSR